MEQKAVSIGKECSGESDGSTFFFVDVKHSLSHHLSPSEASHTLLESLFPGTIPDEITASGPAENEGQNHALIEENLISELILEVWQELRE